MKDFAKVLEEALMERNEVLKKQEELAEEILETALKEFSNPGVSEVYIKKVYKPEGDVQICVDPVNGIETKFSDLIYAQVVYNCIKKILHSEDDEQIEALEDELIINIFEDERGIQFKMEEEDA